MTSLKQIAALSLLACLATHGQGAETNGFQCQMITLPAKDAPSRFAYLDNSGRLTLLAADPSARRLVIYRQGAHGFGNTPDQAIELPPQTAWIAPYHVEANKDFELVMSTAAGVVYYRQNGGVFETQPRPLIKSDQVFTNDDPPYFWPGTNDVMPVVSATEATLYRRNLAAEWKPGPATNLIAARNNWYGERNEWTMGANSSYDLAIGESFLSQPDDVIADEKPENEAIEKAMADMKKAGAFGPSQILRLDLDGDGQKDLILWQVLGQMDFKTDVYIFLRGADGKLPERPSQILHCRGFPMPIGSTYPASPIGDLKGDGTYQLVLLEPRFVLASLSSLWEMALSHGVDMALTIRPFTHGAFARSPEASVPLTIMLSVYGTRQWPFCVCGDFNGDGRLDLMVQRAAGQWDILFSTDDGHWFKPQPAMKFEMPAKGFFARRNFEIKDLNGDGRSDIILRDRDDPRIFLFLTQPSFAKGNP